jgi:hypothetical protein
LSVTTGRLHPLQRLVETFDLRQSVSSPFVPGVQCRGAAAPGRARTAVRTACRSAPALGDGLPSQACGPARAAARHPSASAGRARGVCRTRRARQAHDLGSVGNSRRAAGEPDRLFGQRRRIGASPPRSPNSPR